VEERLRRQYLPDRGRERRPSGLGAHTTDLFQHLEQTIGCSVRAEMDL
jgi:hypothetical protein